METLINRKSTNVLMIRRILMLSLIFVIMASSALAFEQQISYFGVDVVNSSGQLWEGEHQINSSIYFAAVGGSFEYSDVRTINFTNGSFVVRFTHDVSDNATTFYIEPRIEGDLYDRFLYTASAQSFLANQALDLDCTDCIQDEEIDLVDVTLNDFSNDAGFVVGNKSTEDVQDDIDSGANSGTGVDYSYNDGADTMTWSFDCSDVDGGNVSCDGETIVVVPSGIGFIDLVFSGTTGFSDFTDDDTIFSNAGNTVNFTLLFVQTQNLTGAVVGINNSLNGLNSTSTTDELYDDTLVASQIQNNTDFVNLVNNSLSVRIDTEAGSFDNSGNTANFSLLFILNQNQSDWLDAVNGSLGGGGGENSTNASIAHTALNIDCSDITGGSDGDYCVDTAGGGSGSSFFSQYGAYASLNGSQTSATGINNTQGRSIFAELNFTEACMFGTCQVALWNATTGVHTVDTDTWNTTAQIVDSVIANFTGGIQNNVTVTHDGNFFNFVVSVATFNFNDILGVPSYLGSIFQQNQTTYLAYLNETKTSNSTSTTDELYDDTLVASQIQNNTDFVNLVNNSLSVRIDTEAGSFDNSGNTANFSLLFDSGNLTDKTAGGDLTETYPNPTIATGAVQDSEIDYTAVTLNDFINDAGYVANDTQANLSIVIVRIVELRNGTASSITYVNESGCEITVGGRDGSRSEVC